MERFVILAKKLGKALKVFIHSWLYTSLLLGVSYAAAHYGLKARTKIFYDHLPNLFLLVCVLVIISAFTQFWRARWWRGLSQIAAVFYLFMFMMVHLMFYPWNHYADDLKIPEGIPIENPEKVKADWGLVDNKSLDSVMNVRCKPNEFRLASSQNPGYYKFYTRLKSKKPGTVYLKAFEITHNDPLSSESIREKTSCKVSVDEMKLYSQEFSVYEGDPGKPYAVRFELWFHLKGTGRDSKLLEKNYVIEGSYD